MFHDGPIDDLLTARTLWDALAGLLVLSQSSMTSESKLTWACRRAEVAVERALALRTSNVLDGRVTASLNTLGQLQRNLRRGNVVRDEIEALLLEMANSQASVVSTWKAQWIALWQQS